MITKSIKTLLKFDDKNLYYMNNNVCIEKFSWESILEVFAFKRDLFTVDLICIGFRTDDAGMYNEIDEEMQCYNDLVEFLSVPFDGIKVNWFSNVAHPAFETNLVSLWGRKKIVEIWKK